MQDRPFAASSIAALALSCLLGLSSCVDSSTPSSKGSTIDPPAWTFRPGKMQTFTASDPDDPTATFLWSAPPEVKNLSQGSNHITLVAKSAVGKYELVALSSSDGTQAGVCKLEVVDYSFGFSLALGYEGVASHTVYGDVDVVQGAESPTPAPGDAGKIWVAYLNNDTGKSFVKLYASDFQTELHDFPAVFSSSKLPEIAANEEGDAFWIEQSVGGVPTLVQAKTDSTSISKELALILPTSLVPEFDSDLAVTPEGDLVIECLDLSVQHHGFFRIHGAFTSNPTITLIYLSDEFSEAQLDVDSQGRLLIGDNEVPRLFRVTGEGDEATIEALEFMPNTIVDVDEDQQGALYVTTLNRVIVLDTEGDVVFEIKEATVLDNNGDPVVVQFESLVGAGIDENGDLRVIDGRTTDIQNLPIGTVATYNFTIDLQ